ncbi:MAG: hypothetical protein KDC39_14220 [Actinobacteria bacterium]|nr:hypothetical protein [Actinomycetota bacterium]
MGRIGRSVAVAGVVLIGLTATGCTSGETPRGSTDDQAAETEATPPSGFPCTEAPSVGTTTPADLPLPTAAKDGKGSYTTGTVTGPTSWFGGPNGGAPGPFTLTSQWENAGQEIGTNPCNDATDPGKYRSYYAAMRFSPQQLQAPPDMSAYVPYAKESRYHQWDGDPLVADLAAPYSFLYGRKLQITRTVGGKEYSVIVRATDRGPNDTPAEYADRPVDLSPWTMGALTGIEACLDWDGTDPQLTDQCDWTTDTDNTVSVEWADNSRTLGPVLSD